MNNTRHYVNVAYTAILASVFVWGLIREGTGGFYVLLVAACWAVTKIITDGLASLAVIMSQDDDNIKG